jgi:hypothetical protein
MGNRLKSFAPKYTLYAPRWRNQIKKGLEKFPKPLNLLVGRERIELSTY